MDPILDAIDAALKRKGLSDAAASKLAVGHPSLLKNLRMPREGEKRYNLPALKRLADVLDLEFYFGPRRSAPEPKQIALDGSGYALVPLHDAALSAGPGALNGDSSIIGSLAFRNDWLRAQGVSPGTATLARVSGESMTPTLSPGDMVLINTAESARQVPVRRPRPGKTRAPIYALADGPEALVKRLIRPDAGTLILVSDNPDWPPETRTGSALAAVRILGQVVWSAHSWSERTGR